MFIAGLPSIALRHVMERLRSPTTEGTSSGKIVYLWTETKLPFQVYKIHTYELVRFFRI